MKSPTLTGLTEPPNPELIDWLETALESARTGELRHILAVGIYTGREVVTSWTSDVNAMLVTAIGGLRLLEHDLLERIERDSSGRRRSV